MIKSGTKIRAVRAGEEGIPIREGEVYTIKTYAKHGGRLSPEPADDQDTYRKPGVTLREAPGLFFFDRFEVVTEEGA